MEANDSFPERETYSNNEVVQCSSENKVRTRGHWTPVEDEKLRQLVGDWGAHNWNLLARQLPGRSGKSCRLRWCNQLDPTIRKGGFTEIEDEQLLAAHELYGKKWSQIAKLFPGRTDNAVKNQWHVLMARKRREEEQTGSTKRIKEIDGRYNRGLAREMSIGSSSSSGESVVTANHNEPVHVNTDLSLGSSFIQGHNERLITMGLQSNSPLSTGTENCTSSSSKPDISAEELQREKEVTVPPFIDFMGIGSV